MEKVHVLIRGDLLNMRFDSINPLPGEMCRLGQPAEQVPAFSGWLPPENEQNKEAVRVGGRCLKAALYGATHKVIGQKSAEAIVAERPG